MSPPFFSKELTLLLWLVKTLNNFPRIRRSEQAAQALLIVQLLIDLAPPFPALLIAWHAGPHSLFNDYRHSLGCIIFFNVKEIPQWTSFMLNKVSAMIDLSFELPCVDFLGVKGPFELLRAPLRVSGEGHLAIDVLHRL